MGSEMCIRDRLYTGQHWSRAAAAAARNGAEMWVISAGLGLLHVSDPVVPYEATFSSMPFCHRTHWERLTTRPPAERRCTSLRTLMQAKPDDRFVVAASPVYLRAVESDLLAGRGELTTPEHLQVVTSKGLGSPKAPSAISLFASKSWELAGHCLTA